MTLAQKPKLNRDPVMLAAMKIYAASDLNRWPAYWGALEPICWKDGKRELIATVWLGWQWIVTPEGIRDRAAGYAVPKEELWREEKKEGGGHIYRAAGAIEDLDLIDFAEALRIARGYHGKN